MSVTFIEPGGDATFNASITTSGGFWQTAGSVNIATDFVHGNHLKSISYTINSTSQTRTPIGSVADTGTRASVYFYINAYPTAQRAFMDFRNEAGNLTVASFQLTSVGVLKLIVGGSSTQIGSNAGTLNTGQWYRISIAYTITDSTHNRFEVFLDGVSVVSGTNVTLTNTGSTNLRIGYPAPDTAFDLRSSDHYIDDSSSLTDPGNIWVTAKRPNANGTTNGFTTQIGSGGSGYGSGHSPQVNERALSTTNGWSMIGAGSAITEEYSIENQSTGDIDITGSTIVDFMGWVYAKSLSSETASIIVAGASSNISLTSTTTMFTKAAGSTTYPAGSTDIGIITSTTLTTVSLYEAGVMVAYIPAGSLSVSPSDNVTAAETISIVEVLNPIVSNSVTAAENINITFPLLVQRDVLTPGGPDLTLQ